MASMSIVLGVAAWRNAAAYSALRRSTWHVRTGMMSPTNTQDDNEELIQDRAVLFGNTTHAPPAALILPQSFSR